MNELLDVVRAGRADAVPGLVEPMTAADRKEALAALKALRKELRDWSWDRWRERRRIQRALVVAGTGCHTGAAATAAWIGARDLREGFSLPHELMLGLLADREPGWLGDVAHRLAGRASTARLDYPFIAGLVRLAGCPVPDTDEYVHGWAEAAPSHGRLLPALRKDPQLPVMVPRLFETAELPGPLVWYGDATDPHHWPSVLAVLAEEEVVERRLLVDASVARLLRGGKPGDLDFFLKLLDRLALTPDEERDRASDWIGMASDGTSTVAGHAQRVLARLALSGALPMRSLADMSASVLFRPEKKLVRAQLVLMGKVLRADGGGAGELLPVAAEAFGHEDAGIQERALKLVVRHLSAVTADQRSELAMAAARLSPVHRARAAEVFDELPVELDSGPYEEILPPAPEPAPLVPSPSDLAELVEQTSALITSAGAMPDFERVLDGLVRHGYRDRAALAGSLRDALAACWWMKDGTPRNRDEWLSRNSDGVEVVAASVLDRVSTKALWNANTRGVSRGSCAHATLNGVIDARLWEAAYLIRTRPLPFLLATPTWETGALDPDVLVERLGEYQRLCATPAPVDFAQALLRVRRGRDPETARAAAALGTPEAGRLAAWLTGDGTSLPALDGGAEREKSTIAARLGQGLAIRRGFPRAFRWLGLPDVPDESRCYHWSGERHDNWPAVLPEDRETLAAWLLPEVTACARDDQRGGSWWLPLLAESGGPAGRSLHRGVAYGLGARHPEDRLSAVDALLVLATRGDLDGELLGRELASLVNSGEVKANRSADAVRTAAATGAHATVWSVLGAALPGLLAPGTARPGLGEILSVAAECAERCGATGDIPGLAELAGRGGSSRLVAESARLLATLRF
ncbi:DUF6493 family protein [Streptomyces scopuliridis]|uniref:DUF7824 domain-containing protein n=1 Tax=Streptomyces scopuliridis RB72 TaxID=1440053 RepID=A0A2T7T6T1_9ACTN|nr:DUF6493 family protein [Streptomyces scopuliridis]PVE10857.1 hypothetical protein Y717_22970 [Streptomyces scopuliridis RB72]